MRPASGGHPTPFLSGPPLHAGFTPRTGAARAVDRILRITTLGALVAGVAQIGVLGALASELAADAGWPIADLLSSTVGRSVIAPATSSSAGSPNTIIV